MESPIRSPKVYGIHAAHSERAVKNGQAHAASDITAVKTRSPIEYC